MPVWCYFSFDSDNVCGSNDMHGKKKVWHGLRGFDV